jgi:hypothetical protein
VKTHRPVFRYAQSGRAAIEAFTKIPRMRADPFRLTGHDEPARPGIVQNSHPINRLFTIILLAAKASKGFIAVVLP